MSEVFVVAVDGSSGGARALTAAIELAGSTGVSLILAHVIEWSPFTFHTPEELAERHKRREEELERAKQMLLDPAEAKVKAAGVPCKSIIRHGHPAETLTEIARESGAVQIIVGRKGQSKMGTLLFGSVAGTLIQVSTVPVTVVP
jgi:nucleotide-binding universal stress UspA family protein